MSAHRFRGKVAIVTGSSRGIGKGIAIQLARLGATVVLNGRDPDRLRDTESELRLIYTDVLSVCCDVADPEGARSLVDAAVQRFGRIDILVNNVGVSMRGNVRDLAPSVFKSVFESNVLSAAYTTRFAIEYIRQTQGSVCFISSLAGIRGLPGLSAYGASKMALRALAESLRIEEHQSKVHVGLVLVGYTQIESNKETIAADGTRKVLQPRAGSGVQSIESVAGAVVRNLEARKFITVLTPLGKINSVLQSLFPGLVEYIILKNLKKFETKSA